MTTSDSLLTTLPQDQRPRGMPSKMINREHQPGLMLRQQFQGKVVPVFDGMYSNEIGQREVRFCLQFWKLTFTPQRCLIRRNGFVDPAKRYESFRSIDMSLGMIEIIRQGKVPVQ